MKAIVESVAWDDAKSSGANIGAKGSRAYFESAAVSLWSAKRTNPDWEALLVTNTEVPSDVQDILDGFGAIVIHQPFEKFSFPFDVPWHLAYYKLCAVDSVLSTESYQYVCMLDTDTWIRGSLEELCASSRGGGIDD